MGKVRFLYIYLFALPSFVCVFLRAGSSGPVMPHNLLAPGADARARNLAARHEAVSRRAALVAEAGEAELAVVPEAPQGLELFLANVAPSRVGPASLVGGEREGEEDRDDDLDAAAA